MFLLKDTRRQSFFGIVFANFDSRLKNYRSGIGALVDEMNRATRNFRAVSQNVAVSMCAGECGQ